MSSKSEKLEKLRKLQAARNGTSVDDYEDAEADGDRLYDEVDEKEYMTRKRQELLHDDFVVDDDGLGYVDRGVEEDWRENGNEFSDEDDEHSGDHTSKDAKKKKTAKKEKDHPITVCYEPNTLSRHYWRTPRNLRRKISPLMNLMTFLENSNPVK